MFEGDTGGHYDATLIQGDHRRGERRKEAHPKQLTDKTETLKVAIWMKDQSSTTSKKGFVVDILRKFKISVAGLQETFLVDEDELYIKVIGYTE